MTSAAALINSMTCHHLIFEALPKVFKTVLNRIALELVNIFNQSIVVRAYLDLEARHAVEYALIALAFVQI